MTYKALALDLETGLRKDFQKAANLELSNFHSFDQLCKSMRAAAPDIVLLDFPLPAVSARELISKLRSLSVPAILIISGKVPEDETLNDPLIDFIRAPVKPDELKVRVQRLHSLWSPQSSRTTAAVQQPLTRVTLLSVPELRNKKSGRLDAASIANFFGLSLNELARLLRRPHTSVHKTPDAQSLQEGLYPYERVLSAAKHILADKYTGQAFKMWLNTKAKPLGDSPLAVIKTRKVEMLADWLEDAVLGLPE